jgi:hypothetical protein
MPISWVRTTASAGRAVIRRPMFLDGERTEEVFGIGQQVADEPDEGVDVVVDVTGPRPRVGRSPRRARSPPSALLSAPPIGLR